MKVLYLASVLSVQGGGGSHARGLVTAFRDEGHEVLALPEASTDVRVNRPRLHTIPEPIKLMGREVRAQIRLNGNRHLLGAIDRFAPEVAVVRRSTYDLLADLVCQQARCPVVAEANAVVSVEAATWGESIPSFEARRERNFYLRADRVSCISDEVAADVERLGVDSRKIIVVENGVDSDLFSPDVPVDPSVGEWARRFESIVGYCGSTGGLHDMQALFDAADAVLERRPDTGFLWVGVDTETVRALSTPRARLNSLALGRIAHDRVPRALAASTVCWGAFHFEYGSPLKVYEYAALGKPLVVAGAGSPVRTAQKMRLGIVADRGSVFGLAEGVLSLLDRPLEARAIGASARRWIEQERTWGHVAREMIQGLT